MKEKVKKEIDRQKEPLYSKQFTFENRGFLLIENRDSY